MASSIPTMSCTTHSPVGYWCVWSKGGAAGEMYSLRGVSRRGECLCVCLCVCGRWQGERWGGCGSEGTRGERSLFAVPSLIIFY